MKKSRQKQLAIIALISLLAMLGGLLAPLFGSISSKAPVTASTGSEGNQNK